MKPIICLASLATLLLTVSPSLAQQAVELKPQWIVGKRYAQLMEMKQQSSITMGDQKMDQNVGTTTEASITVTPHEDGRNKRLVIRYERVAMDMEMMGQKMAFDSNKPESGNDPMGIGKAMSAFAGKELRLVVDPLNKIVDFENLDALTKPMGEANPMMGQMVKQMFNKETISQMLDQSAFKALPGKAVKPGDTWPYSVNMTLPQIGAFSIKGTYVFKGMVERGGAQCAEVTEEGKLAIELDKANIGGSPEAAKAMETMGMKIDGGTLAGTTWFDPALGMTREARFTQSMTMRMNNPTKPGESMEIPMKQEISVKLTGVTDAK